jgi:hypothetical protein
MSIPLNDDDPRQSALRDGIVIGVIACLRYFQLDISRINIMLVLRSQQGWEYEEIEYFLKFFGID